MAGGRVQLPTVAWRATGCASTSCRCCGRSIPARTRNVLATAAQLRDEAQVLEQAVDEALRRTGAGGHPPAVDAARLAAEPSPRAPAGAAPAGGGCRRRAGRPRPGATRARSSASPSAGAAGRWTSAVGCRRLSSTGSSGSARGRADARAAGARLPWRSRAGAVSASGRSSRSASRRPAPATCGSLDEPVLDADRLAHTLTVRAWRDGDRMQPLGLGGTKSLQDLFGDRKVPRSLRRSLPVVESDGEIAWVAGVAVSDALQASGRTPRRPCGCARQRRPADGASRLAAVATLERMRARGRDGRRGGRAPAPRRRARSARSRATTRVATSS